MKFHRETWFLVRFSPRRPWIFTNLDIILILTILKLFVVKDFSTSNLLQGRGERYSLGSVSKFRRDDGCALYHVHACRASGGGKDEVEGEVSNKRGSTSITTLRGDWTTWMDDAYSLGTHALVEQDV